MRSRVALAGLLFALSVVGCAHEPPPDPRAADRERLFALEREPIDPRFASQARLVLSSALMAAEVQRTLNEASATVEALRFTVPFLGEVSLRPRMTVRSVRAEPEAACAGCVALLIDLDGVVAPVTGGGGLPGLKFEGTARGVFALETIAVGDATELRARGAAGTDTAGRHGWSARIALKDMPVGFSESVSDSVTGLVQRLMESEARPDLLLASLPKDGPVKLRGVRPGAEGGAIVVDIAFVALDAGVVPSGLPSVAGGYALQLPEKTLLALLRAETLRMAPQDGYVVDPTAVAVDGERFTLDLAVYELKGAVVRRDVRVDGMLSLTAAGLQIAPNKAQQTARSGGFDPFDFIIEAALLSKVTDALKLAVPVAQSASVGGRTRTARLTTLTDLGDVLQIDGVVDDGRVH